MNLIRLAGLMVAVALIAATQQNSAVMITHIEGKVYLDEKPADTTALLNENGVIRTEAGPAEIHLRTGTTFLGENSSIRILANRPYNFALD